MPELAAHLERVARDVTDKLANAAAFYTMEYMAAKERGEHMPYGLDSVLKPIVAAALAACAREEAKWWAKYHGKDYNGEGTARLAALERALGEKGAGRA